MKISSFLNSKVSIKRINGMDSRGVALVELTVILPVLIMLVFGLSEVCRVISAKVEMDRVTYEAGTKLASLSSLEQGKYTNLASDSKCDASNPTKVTTNTCAKHLSAQKRLKDLFKANSDLAVDIDKATIETEFTAHTASPTKKDDTVRVMVKADLVINGMFFKAKIPMSTEVILPYLFEIKA